MNTAVIFLDGDGIIRLVRWQNFRKTNICYPLGGKNNRFSEKFTNLLNEWSQ